MSWSSPASILEKIIELRGRARDQGLERSQAPARSARSPLLRVLPSGPGRRAADLRRGGAVQRHPRPRSTRCSTRKAARRTPMPTPPVAVFYSISNCQEGLRGISFGNFLIKQVVEELTRELPIAQDLCHAVAGALVPLLAVPGACRRPTRLSRRAGKGAAAKGPRAGLERGRGGTGCAPARGSCGRRALLPSARKTAPAGRSIAVARFHLGNGARLERLNWLGDTSEKGIRQGLSLMVNYRYDLRDIERNHEAYVNQGSVAASKSVRSLLAAPEKRAGARSGARVRIYNEMARPPRKRQHRGPPLRRRRL